MLNLLNSLVTYHYQEKNNQRGISGVISTDDSTVKVLVIPTDEELMIAKDTYELINK